MSAPPAKFDAEKADNFEDVSCPPLYAHKILLYTRYCSQNWHTCRLRNNLQSKVRIAPRSFSKYPAINTEVSCSTYVHILGNPWKSPRILSQTHKNRQRDLWTFDDGFPRAWSGSHNQWGWNEEQDRKREVEKFHDEIWKDRGGLQFWNNVENKSKIWIWTRRNHLWYVKTRW